jgi:DNA-binding NarL/FixJ family response regulator
LRTPIITVLLVEDSRPYRSFIASLLGENAGWTVVGEVADGIDAVTKAQELRPTFILLDIGLPMLNGLEAARRIREIVPVSKIVFLTLEADVDVVQEALNLGACGYLLKQLAGSELIPGLTAILDGQRFISRGVFENGV